MEIKKTSVILVLFLLTPFFLPAQEINEQEPTATITVTPGFYIEIDPESGETHFRQRLVWAGGEFAFRYDVAIERLVGTTFRPYKNETREEHYVWVSLPPGMYRFRITPYDVFERPGEPTAWEQFEVFHALQPEIAFAFSETIVGRSREALGLVINLSGQNVHSRAQFFLAPPYKHTEIETQYPYTDPQIVYIPINAVVFGSGGNVSLFIDRSKIVPGEYAIIVRNPGGLEARIDGLVFQDIFRFHVRQLARLERRSPPVFKLGVNWNPVFPIYGSAFGDENLLGGISARAALLFKILNYTYLGPELTAAWAGQNRTFGANLLLERSQTGGNLILGLRVGYVYPAMLDSLRVVINMGAYFGLRLTNHFFIEAGLDFNHVFSFIYSGILVPWAGFVLRF